MYTSEWSLLYVLKKQNFIEIKIIENKGCLFIVEMRMY